jgi:hypothetical protein
MRSDGGQTHLLEEVDLDAERLAVLSRRPDSREQVRGRQACEAVWDRRGGEVEKVSIEDGAVDDWRT